MAKRESRREREMRKQRLLFLSIIVGLIVIVTLGLVIRQNGGLSFLKGSDHQETTEEVSTEDPQEIEKRRIEQVIAQAERIAAGYDFDGAIEYLKADKAYRQTLSMLETVERFGMMKEEMKAWKDVREIPQIFVRTLIADPSLAFDGDAKADSYNSNYITVDEFQALLEQLYENDYVLVSIHDLAEMTEVKRKVDAPLPEPETIIDEEGNVLEVEVTTAEPTYITEYKMKAGSIMLPEGKKPFVLSQENVCYPFELQGEGFAEKLVVKQDGSVLSRMTRKDGSTEEGAYDLVPVLEAFLEEHPDFSYRGARAVLAVSGSEGVFGYHTDAGSSTNETYEAECSEAKAVAQRLAELGYEFAFNGYHYTNMGYVSMDETTFQSECQAWLAEVVPIVGETDIIVFPNGDDVGDWHYYSGTRYEYLKELGFDYFINMNQSEKCWLQLLDAYVRQGRHCISRGALYQYMQGESLLDDMFNASKIFDSSYPAPVR